MVPIDIALTRLALAIVFGALIGIEREWRHKTAGIKTNTLVALGAAGFAMISNTFGADNHNPALIAGAVVGGIGFIGAGVIIHRGATVQGVTTAATLWANSSVGVCVGLGQLNVAVVLFASVLVAQFAFRWLAQLIERKAARRALPGRFELRIDCDHDTLHEINETWKSYAADADIQSIRRSSQRKPDSVLWRAVFVTSSSAPVDLTQFEEKLLAIKGVQRVQVHHLGVEDAG
ncbi:MAG TPA: MgtC/SapB family protein [Thermoanaerobaculia bacterium]|nr:MgtC/SapB family protein [Thermoanaerobaculia bacterium]